MSRALIYATSREWLNLELTMAQLRTLTAVNDAEGLTVSALAARLGARLPTASVLADRLVDAGLILRMTDADDRRRVLLRLSARGTTLIARLRGSPPLARWIADLAPADVDALDRGLQALAEIADAEKSVGRRRQRPQGRREAIR